MSFGAPSLRKGFGWSGRASDVPLPMLQHTRLKPLPALMSGSDDVTFTLNGSVTNPIVVWNGDDFIFLEETVAYTFAEADNTILSSTGAETTGAAATGVWYVYLALKPDRGDGAGSYEMRTSTTAPGYVQGEFNAGFWGHPGTTRTAYWSYVGFFICSNATGPVNIGCTKLGYWWQFDTGDIKGPTADSIAAVSLASGALPAFATEVSGTLETGSGGFVKVSSDADGYGEQHCGVVAGALNYSPFTAAITGGEIFAHDDTARGDVEINAIKDLV